MTAVKKSHAPYTWPWKTPEPGVYFDMSFEEYLSIPCLSNSALKQLLVSGPNFWEDSWMNPEREIVEKDPTHLMEGRAYHCRVLEGVEEYQKRFAPAFDPDDSIDWIDTMQDIKDELKAMDLPVTCNRKADGINRLIAAEPSLSGRIYQLAEVEYLKQHEGKDIIKAKAYHNIELSAAAIRKNPFMDKWVAGGHTEVSVIWWDEELQALCKCRFDYLKIGSCTDLKTFANERNRSIEKAVSYSMASFKYDIQSTWYLRGASAARELVRNKQVHSTRDIDEKWLDAFQKKPVTEFRFIFHQKGRALVTLGKIHSVNNQKMQSAGTAKVQMACDTFNKFLKVFGPNDIWIYTDEPQHFDYDALPAFINDL